MQVAVVSQEPELFSCSIHNNITYGLGSYSEDVLQTAVKQAHINSFVHSLKDGYDTGNTLHFYHNNFVGSNIFVI